uniref:Uncharacterized protein n=1 Tax=Strongyloides papillosus TaxID=174720 RepID=A0A0N5CHC4_STREA
MFNGEGVVMSGTHFDVDNDPLPGTDVLEHARSGIQEPVIGDSPRMELKYLFYAMNGLMLFLILVVLAIIINSVFLVKYSPIKKRRNQVFQEYFKAKAQNSIKYNDYDKLLNDLEVLKKDIERNEKIKTKRNKERRVIKKNCNHKKPVIVMNEEKLAEVFHALAKMPSDLDGIVNGDGSKKRGVLMIGENETVCVMNRNDDGNKTARSIDFRSSRKTQKDSKIESLVKHTL